MWKWNYKRWWTRWVSDAAESIGRSKPETDWSSHGFSAIQRKYIRGNYCRIRGHSTHNLKVGAWLTNLAWACPWCNTHKHTKTYAPDPQTGKQVLLFNPRLQKWEQHFRWSDDFLSIVGHTQTGRATVDALNMNRFEHINLRKLLQMAGKHPPT
jgi:hypothetical protein